MPYIIEVANEKQERAINKDYNERTYNKFVDISDIDFEDCCLKKYVKKKVDIY